MGYRMSKVKKKTGDEAAALEIIRTLPFKTQRLLNMNKGLGIQYDYHTLLHLAALRGMPNLVRVILEDFGGDPNWLEDNVGKFPYGKFTRAKELKDIDSVENDQACVKVLLEWRARMINQYGNGTYLTEGNNAIDTGLHLAAADGVIAFVEELIKTGISPFMVKKESLEPSDEANASGYYCTALMLDTIMTMDKEIRDEEKSSLRMREDDEACFSFDFNMISDLTGGNLEDMFTLRNIEKVLGKSNIKISSITDYYRERLSIKWTTDLISCFKRAGITVSHFGASSRYMIMMDGVLGHPTNERYFLCPICMMAVQGSSRPTIKIKCGHNFCSLCWQSYLTEKIDNECQISIICPVYNCNVVIPNRVVESMISPELVRKYRSLKLMAFINSGNFIKWCPVSDCGLAVRLSVPRYWKRVYQPFKQTGLLPSRAVECGNGHSFCWECLGSCHAPMPCDQWQMWLKRAREHDPEAIPKKIKECAETVNHLWIMEQSKVCPMCKAPTQEIDGCKYMSCTQCEYVFRYICLGVCEIRPTLTGGLAECITPTDYSSVRSRLFRSIRREISDVDEASRSEFVGSSSHKECSNVDEALRSGNVICTRHKECSDIIPRQRGRYVLILHKEYSDLDEVLRGGYYTFDRTDDAYQMIDKLRQKYFVCTRNEEFYDVDETEEKLMAEAIMKTQERRGLKKFNRYYLKYMENLKILEREKYYFKVICDRVESIERELILKKESPEKGKERAQFLITGMSEVLRTRETLVWSYPYAYYLDEMGFNTDVVCRQQGEFEALIKTLMDMVVMPRREKFSELPPRLDITNLTMTCRRARYGFMRVVTNSIYKQDLFSAIKKEKKKYRNYNFGSQVEDNKENHYSAVSSAGAANGSDTIQRGKSFQNSNHSWLESTSSPEFEADEALSDSGSSSCEEEGCRNSKVRDPGTQEGDYYCPKCQPNDSQCSAFYMTPWRRVEIREKIPQATAEGMENRIASCLSFATHTPRDVNANGATALSMRQQEADVGVTIGNVIQEADAESAHHSKTNGDQQNEPIFDISFENDFQGVTKIAGDTLSHDTEVILGEEVDSFIPNQSEDGLCTNSGGIEVSLSTENSQEQLAGDPESNTHLDFDFEEEEEANEQSPKRIEKPGYSKTKDKMSRDSTIPEFQYLRQNLPSRTIEGEASSNPLKFIKAEAKISILTESGVFEEVVESKNGKMKMKQNEFMDAIRDFGKDFLKPACVKSLLHEASNTSTFSKQEGYFGDTSSSQTSQVKPKGNEFSRYCPEMMSTGKANDGEMMMLENQETDFRSATEFLNLKDQGPRPFPTRKEDFCAPPPVRSDYKHKKEHKKPSLSDGGEYLTKKHSLHTEDSSFEYESITGLPKSPNLCISGVFITRTPESGHISRKDAQMLQSSLTTSGRYYSSPKVQEALEKYKATGRMFGHCGGSDRSSSLSDRGNDSYSLNTGLISTSHLGRNSCFPHRSVTPPRYSFSIKDNLRANRSPFNYDKIPGPSVNDLQVEIAKGTRKSKLSSEPEERKMFPLHKSPTEGALSSVLYVNENYSSEDDFHEVLFLLGRSQRDPAKRKKKKERDRKTEFPHKEDRDDFSSAL